MSISIEPLMFSGLILLSRCLGFLDKDLFGQNEYAARFCFLDLAGESVGRGLYPSLCIWETADGEWTSCHKISQGVSSQDTTGHVVIAHRHTHTSWQTQVNYLLVHCEAKRAVAYIVE